MQKVETLIRTKLRLPFTRPELVLRPRLQERIAHGLRGPLTLITAPAGFGKTTLVASYIADCGMPVAWLSLDKNDNQAGRFLNYLIAALQGVDQRIGNQAAQFMAQMQPAPPEAVLTSLINDLDTASGEMALVLDDYQFISSQAVHEAVTFLLEHCPKTFHVVVATRSDPPLPLTRLRARGQMVELRAADLSFSVPEAAQFLNDIMGLNLDAGSVTVLAKRTEGWIAGLQMASIALQSHLSMRGRDDVLGFIEGFSGTNRYILDYLLEEVLASQAPEIQRFLLYTSILERLSAPLCEAILETEILEDWIVDTLSANFQPSGLLKCQPILESLERANLFLVPLDDERQWYRYHHLFADLLRTQLQNSIGDQGLARLHLRASAWYEQNGSILEAIHHASLAFDFERIERLIEQNYIEMVNRGEMSYVRYWMGKLSKELVYRRPWLCLYEALNRSWFGQLEEANLLLNEAEKHIRPETSIKDSTPDTQTMRGYHAYVQSRITAMQGDIRRAIDLGHRALEYTPAENLGLQIEMGITLGFEYFLYGDFENANQILDKTIRSSNTVRAINTPVAAYCILARIHVHQGLLHEAYELYQKAAQLTHQADGQYLGATGLVEVGIADVLCEWNDLEAALVRVKQGLDWLPLWGKADDLCLAYATLARIHLAQGERTEAAGAIEKAVKLIQTRGVFLEAQNAVETTQVRVWLAQDDRQAASRWAVSLDEKEIDANNPFQFADEIIRITRARVFLAQDKPEDALSLLSNLEETARSCGRMGRLIEILILKALATQRMGDTEEAHITLTESLSLAEPSGYMRVFLDEASPLQLLLAQWLAHAGAGSLRDYAAHLLSQFETEAHEVTVAQEKGPPTGVLIEPLSQRELEVIHLIAVGYTNKEIAQELVVAPGTVKAHTSSIYRKLDVTNRTEAAARARQLGILP
ncbi:MAG: LuxR C-terminal-related transcriptional regulator [Anaerolineales bacterium]